MTAPLTKEDCVAILDRYRNWNEGQTSVSMALRGARTVEDDILDERRALVLAATKRLRELCEQRS